MTDGLTVSKAESMTTMAGSMAAGRQAWHSSNAENLHLETTTMRSSEKQLGVAWAFETSELIP